MALFSMCVCVFFFFFYFRTSVIHVANQKRFFFFRFSSIPFHTTSVRAQAQRGWFVWEQVGSGNSLLYPIGNSVLQIITVGLI